MIKYTSKGMIKQVKNEKIQQNTLFLETAESPSQKSASKSVILYLFYEKQY